MQLIQTPQDMRHARGQYQNERVALVPTMGCLHEGHLSLIEKAKHLADIVVVSIYVNPLQFNDKRDLDTYPQPFEEDIAACKKAGVDMVFHPQNLYPEYPMQVGLHVNTLAQTLCGAHRPGHFDGVVTVVNILFNIVQPDIAVFGEKDFQQLSIIRRMVADLHMPVDIIESPTVREADGLAKSSRNTHLSEQERQTAAAIPQALRAVQQAVKQGASLEAALQAGRDVLQQHRIQPDYFGIYRETDLLPATEEDRAHALRIFIAAPIGTTRLIDNMPLDSTAEKG